jgi:hypothetical protein
VLGEAGEGMGSDGRCSQKLQVSFLSLKSDATFQSRPMVSTLISAHPATTCLG